MDGERRRGRAAPTEGAVVVPPVPLRSSPPGHSSVAVAEQGPALRGPRARRRRHHGRFVRFRRERRPCRGVQPRSRGCRLQGAPGPSASGPREFVGPALSAGLVEFVPEYAGTASEFYSLGACRAERGRRRAHMPSLSARSTAADFVALARGPGRGRQHVRRHRSRRRAGSTSKSSAISRRSPTKLTFGGPPECPTRRLCLVGLVDTYRLKFGEARHPRRRRHADPPGAEGGDCRRRADVHHRSGDRQPRPGRAGRRPRAAAGREHHPARQDRGRRSIGAPLSSTVIDDVSARLTTAAVRDLNGAASPAGTDVGSRRVGVVVGGRAVTTDAGAGPGTDSLPARADAVPHVPPNVRRTRRVRRPSGAPPPLPRSIGRSGTGLDRRRHRARRVDDRDAVVARGAARAPTRSTRRSSARSPGGALVG